MEKTILVLPDGQEISSGAGVKNAIISSTVTSCVNSGTELTLGSVCSAMAELKLLTPEGALQMEAGDRLEIYKENGSARRLLGIFYAQKPERTGPHTLSLTAYDAISLLDQDLTGWLGSLTGWPYCLQDFAAMVCQACGLEFVNKKIPNGGYMVQKFAATGITGRKLLGWAAEAAGRFCRATPEGKAEFSWYTPSAITLGATAKNGGSILYDPVGLLTITDQTAQADFQENTLTVLAESWDARAEEDALQLTFQVQQQYYFQSGLTFADFETAPIEKVQIGQTADDVGAIFPQIPEAVNTYKITGNLLLTDQRTEVLQPVAQTIYENLQGFSYTPCKVTVPLTPAIEAGHILSVTDKNGVTHKTIVMTKKQTGQKETLESTGSQNRQSVAAVNDQSYSALSGKILNLRTDVEGIKAENKDANGKMAALELTVDGISARVQQQKAESDTLQENMTWFRQTADEIKLSVETIQNQGADKVKTHMGYTFDDSGLQISRSDAPLKNQLTPEGMQVKRNGEVILKADISGVLAVDVTVDNYLIVGEHARLEDYEYGRTACFYL